MRSKYGNQLLRQRKCRELGAPAQLKAQREGKFKGRVPTAKRQTDEIKTLIAEGLKPHQIAAQLNIGVASVYRYR